MVGYYLYQYELIAFFYCRRYFGPIFVCARLYKVFFSAWGMSTLIIISVKMKWNCVNTKWALFTKTPLLEIHDILWYLDQYKLILGHLPKILFPSYSAQNMTKLKKKYSLNFALTFLSQIGHLPLRLGHWVVYLFRKYMIKFTLKVYKLAPMS